MKIENSVQNPCAHTHAKRKRCYDVMLSRQEGSTTRHLASTHWDRTACGGIMHSYKATFSVVWRAGLRRLD